jgi:hypothetical protein
MTHCAAFTPMRVSVVKPDKDRKASALSFKAELKTTQILFVIYANSEAINHEIHEVTTSGKTAKYSSEHHYVSIRARVESNISTASHSSAPATMPPTSLCGSCTSSGHNGAGNSRRTARLR